MEPVARVCPFCGAPPGTGVFCEGCGRNLSAVEQLPTREAWEASATVDDADPRTLEQRCAEALTGFLAAMHAAGDPGAEKLPKAKQAAFKRAGHVRGWRLRPVDRDDDVSPRRYQAGLFLTVDGDVHQLDSELRGWGQRDFPHYHHTVSAEPIEMPVDGRLVGELARLLSKQPG